MKTQFCTYVQKKYNTNMNCYADCSEYLILASDVSFSVILFNKTTHLNALLQWEIKTKENTNCLVWCCLL